MDSILYYLGMSGSEIKELYRGSDQFRTSCAGLPSISFSQGGSVSYRSRCLFAILNPPVVINRKPKRLSSLRDFLDDNPDGPFLNSARKYLDLCFENLPGKTLMRLTFYIKINELESAVVCFKTFLQDHPQSNIHRSGSLHCCRAANKTGKKSESRNAGCLNSE